MIEGADYYLDGGGSVRIFYVESSGNLTVNAATIQHGYSRSSSGVIYNDYGTVTVIGSTFSGNSAYYGGVIYNSYGTVTVTDSTFFGNSATFGGGIYNIDGTVTVTGSTFSGNSTGGAGGGIYSYRGTVTVTGSTFSGNSATYSGGGIYNDYGTVTVTGSSFDGNSTGGIGGGIYSYRGTVTVTGSTFSGNFATYYGGGIYNENGTVTVTGSTFSGNSAADGGGIYNYYYGTVTVTSSTFASNSATYSGGGIYNYYYGTVTVTGSTFAGNSATDGGGICNYYDGTVTVTSSTFSGNSATTNGYSIDNNGTMSLAGNIFADSTSGNNCYNSTTLTDNGYNLSSDATCVSAATSKGSVTNLNLGGLTDNGGSTLTHLPGTGSAAIGAIPNGTVIQNPSGTTVWTCGDSNARDQLGSSRPINSGSACTVGAVEVTFAATVSTNANHTPQYTAEDHARAQAPLCADLDGSTNPIIRADVPNGTITEGSVFCRVLAQDGAFATTTGAVGDLAVLERGVIQAIDVFGLQHDGASVPQFNAPVTLCLQGSGVFLFLDAMVSPRTVTELPVYTRDGYTCATVPNAGTIVLVRGATNATVAAPVLTGPATALTDCMVTTRDILNLRDTPSARGAVIRMIPYDVTLTALQQADGWYYVDYNGERGWISAGYVTPQDSCGQ